MKRFRTDFEATHHDWLVNQLAQKQAAAVEASEAAAAAKRAVAHRVKKMTILQEKAQKAAREVAAVNEAIKHFLTEQAREVKVNVNASEVKSAATNTLAWPRISEAYTMLGPSQRTFHPVVLKVELIISYPTPQVPRNDDQHDNERVRTKKLSWHPSEVQTVEGYSVCLCMPGLFCSARGMQVGSADI